MALMRVALVAHDPHGLAQFYQTALGFTLGLPKQLDDALPDIAERVFLRYGDNDLELLAFDPPGRPFPSGQTANSLSFQHFAIVTPDIAVAYETLHAARGWQPISTTGPVHLPASSGGAIAFKFRDPEGHPLELLQLPEGNTPRIDHSAIVVRHTAASLAFYAGFGLVAQGGSHNQGGAQGALDGLEGADVQVTRLGDAAGKLHLELLCYEGAAPPAPEKAPNDVIATRLVFDEGVPGQQRDPDGHDLLIESTMGLN